MSKINEAELKEVVAVLNKATYKDGDGKEVSFLDTKIKTIGMSAEKLAFVFAQTIESIDDSITGQLPDAVIDFYNKHDFPAKEPVEEAKSEKKEEKPVAKTLTKKSETKKEEPKKPEKKAEKAKVQKTAKKKEPAELSVFGHKMNTQSAKLDALLATGKGFTKAELAKQSGRSELGVMSHIKHLRDDRKLTINEKDGVFKYVKTK